MANGLLDPGLGRRFPRVPGLAVVHTDPAGVVQHVTPAFEELVEVGGAEIVGRSMLTFFDVTDRGLVARRLMRLGREETFGRRLPDLVVRLRAAHRLVPCLVGLGMAGAVTGRRGLRADDDQVAWALLRAGVWATGADGARRRRRSRRGRLPGGTAESDAP